MTAEKSNRVILKSVAILPLGSGRQTNQAAQVVLSLAGKEVTGTTYLTDISMQDPLRAIATATLAALYELLPAGVIFDLKSVSVLHPPFLDDPLIIVIIDSQYDDLAINLTGASITEEKKTKLGVAAAILDATNRLVSFLLTVAEEDRW